MIICLCFHKSAVATGPPSSYQLFVKKTGKLPTFISGNLQAYLPSKTIIDVYEDETIICIIKGIIFSGPQTASALSEAYKSQHSAFTSNINGQYVIFIYDKLLLKLMVYRDHLGIFTAFYTVEDECLWMADSWMPLARLISDITERFNWIAALNYKGLYNTPEKSMVEGIMQIPSGYFIETNVSGNIKLIKYWAILDHNSDSHDTNYFRRMYRELLNDAIYIRIKEKPFANIFLSGGIDSSAIALLASTYIKLYGYSILNPLTFLLGDSDKAYRLSQQLDISLLYHIFAYKLMKPDPAVWLSLIQNTESTDLDIGSVIKYYVYRHIPSANRDEYIPMLTGYGSDQFYGGITRTTLNEVGIGYDNKDHWTAYCQILKKNRLEHLLNKWDNSLKNYVGFLNIEYIEQFMKSDAYPNDWVYKMHQEHQRFNLTTVRPEVNISRSAGHQVLFPFMDHRLVNLAASIPASLQGELLFDKQIVRALFDSTTRQTISAHLPKTSIRVDNRNNPTHDFYYQVIYAKRDGLAALALDTINQLPPVFNIPVLKQQINGLANKKDRSFTEWLLPLLNSIALFTLIKKDTPDPLSGDLPIIITSGEYFTDPKKVKKLLSLDEEPSLDPAQLQISKHVKVLYSEEKDLYYISEKERIVFEVRPTSIQIIYFLRALMKGEDIEEILNQTNYQSNEMNDFIKFAIQENVLTKKEN